MIYNLNERLKALAAFLPMFEDPEFSFGHWSEPKEVHPGVSEMPYYCFSGIALDFLKMSREYGWVLNGFDWPTWIGTPEAEQLRNNPEVLNKATPEQLARILTAVIRGERFCDGAVADSFEAGLITGICRRASQLLKESDENAET